MRHARLSTVVLAALTLLALAEPAPAQRSFSIEQVMSAPFPGNLVAAPTGSAVAWVFNAGGVRNIWMASEPGYQARRLTNYSDDDGQAISNLNWTPDGTSIVFVRGGSPNRQGDLPNPWSLADGVKRELLVVDTAGGEPRVLAEGSSPLVAPAGDIVVFIKSGAVWTVPLDGGEPEALVRARGGFGDLVFSPDGTRLAFASQRGDHSFIGVLEMESRSVTWIDPSVDRDGDPVWS
ncbi:MAG TPA: S9 family peptidase, partial [Gemmatimonadota bacterium]|nr:S9 family peptidase [Gemmatimonadota bacterium]